MALTKAEFYALRALVLNDDDVADVTPEERAQALVTLQEKGYVADGAATDGGLEALEPYKVKNAILQAAGFSSRFAPISYDLPKGLIEVRGEILAERQIRQLLEAGITDITVVTGHLAEKYAYFADKFGVKIIHNPEYPFRNTNSTMHRVHHLVGNTYILDSDHYITKNPFKPYVWESYYPTLEDDDPGEWYMVMDENRYITDMLQMGSGERLHGPAYITTEMAAVMKPYLDEIYYGEEFKNEYWEYTLWSGRGKLKVYCALQPHGFINEFDSMADLEAYDPDYLNHVVSPSLDNICAALGCERADIKNCKSLTHDATSSTCSFTVGDKAYVYYHPKGYEGSAGDSWRVTPLEG